MLGISHVYGGFRDKPIPVRPSIPSVSRHDKMIDQLVVLGFDKRDVFGRRTKVLDAHLKRIWSGVPLDKIKLKRAAVVHEPNR